MIQNREAFLNNIAHSLGRPRQTSKVERPTWTTQPQYDIHHGLSQDDLVEVLSDRCSAIHTDFKRTSIENLPATLWETMRNYKVKSVIAPWDERNDAYGLTKFYDEIDEEGLEYFQWDAKKGEDNVRFAERADVGITFSDLTLAESATVTLFNNKYNGRTISLLPTSYIAIIPKSTIVPRLTQATKHIHQAQQEGHQTTSSISFISGPSNSADIEMNLIVGVHGPVQATYIVVDD